MNDQSPSGPLDMFINVSLKECLDMDFLVFPMNTKSGGGGRSARMARDRWTLLTLDMNNL